jgi:hypothetical protein
MVSSSLWILVDKQMFSRYNEAFGMIDKFLLYESEQCKNVTVLGFATWPHLNRSARQPISSSHDENNYRWQSMWTLQYPKVNLNGASTICGIVGTVINL